MKLNLQYHGNNTLSGFVNVDPFCQPDDSHVPGPVDHIDYLCEDGECEHIVAEDVLSYFPARNVASILDNWLAKLRHGGILTVCDVDINEVAKGITNKQIDLTKANVLLYNDQGEPRKSGLTGFELAKSLEECGFKVNKFRLNSYRFVVEVQRP
jgi:hypothetical protein